MSKKLTEKWLKGDLAAEGVYYWRISDGQELIKNQLTMFAYRLCSDTEKIECLAPVPSYEELQKLKEQLKEANDIIKKCADYCSVGCYYDERDEEMALDSKFYLKKWGVK